MENIDYIFRNVADHSDFISYGKLHILILLLALIGSLIIFVNNTESRRLELFIGFILILQQATLYIWYFVGKYRLIKEGLPLYHCRIAILSVGFGLVLNKNALMKIGSYLGIFGSTLALIFPGLDPFRFPHITQYSFFVGHIFLLWGSFYLLFIKKVGMTENDLKNSLIFINIYHVSMFVLNNIIGSNYAYMTSSPISVGNNLNPLVYAFLVISIFNAILNIEYILINKNSSIELENQVSANSN